MVPRFARVALMKFLKNNITLLRAGVDGEKESAYPEFAILLITLQRGVLRESFCILN